MAALLEESGANGHQVGTRITTRADFGPSANGPSTQRAELRRAGSAKYVPKDRLNGLIGEHIMKSLQIDQCWLASVRRWMQSSAAIARPDVGPHCRAHRTTPWKLNPRTALYAGGSSGGFRDDEHPDVSGNARTVFMKLGFGWQSKF